jgi:hypothetical protein
MRTVNKALWVPFLFALGLGTAARADAQQADAFVPHIIPVQGLLTDPEGIALEGEHDVSVALFKVADGGNPLLHEVHANVAFDHGQFTVPLGAKTDNGVAFDGLVQIPQLWLEVSVDNELLKPRVRLGSVPYAAAAELCGDARKLGGHPASEFATSAHTHAWSEITSVPAGIKDGTDADTLAGLSCTGAGAVARHDGSKWVCDLMSASDISAGTLSTSYYSAYADLQTENRLGASTDTSILTRGAADTRYMSSSFTLTPTYQTVVASNGGTSTAALTGRVCALSAVAAPGVNGSCSVTGAGPSFTLTATAQTMQTTTCTAVCF